MGATGGSEPVSTDASAHKKVLVTGAHSYIGEAFENYAGGNYAANFEINTVDMTDEVWRERDFSPYDVVFHVAGIAHADAGNVPGETRRKYYAVNTDLAIETAQKAKTDGVKQFVFMSSMIVYGESAGYGQKKVITKDTVPAPANFYGDSKWQADKGIRALEDEAFHVTVLRPPMIYGKGSRGNYPVLAKLAKKLPVFPKVSNERSMLYIDNLCEFLCQIMLAGRDGVFMPQNAEYADTSGLAVQIAAASGKKLRTTALLAPAVRLGSRMPGKTGVLVNKAFGSMVYDQGMSTYEGLDYRKVGLKESIVRTEGKKTDPAKRVLILASVASMIDQFNMPSIKLLQSMGFSVDVACNFEKGSTCTAEKITALKAALTETGVEYCQVDFDRNVMNLAGNWKAYCQVKKAVREKKYAFIHCHSPAGGVVGRIVGHELGIKVIYTAHGFHFYDGAPLKNWMLYYPVEKALSRWTDTLVTINTEDFERAKKQFHAKRTVYIPGVGIDTERFRPLVTDTAAKRSELGIGRNDILLLSVGELSARKNHETVIRAVATLPKTLQNSIRYCICGQGELEDYLKALARKLDVKVILPGFRTDIAELCGAADLFVFPSRQEGLPVALMEAVACRTPVVCSSIRGSTELVREHLFDPANAEELAGLLAEVLSGKKAGASVNTRQKMEESIAANYSRLMKFDLNEVERELVKLYSGVGGVKRFEGLRRFISRKRFMERLGIPDDGIILLSVGELNENKNHVTVIKALAQLKDKRLHYCIAGKGALENMLRETAEKTGVNLHLLGYCNDIPRLLDMADVFVHPSFREGLPVALMEAMAAGLPVIASDIRGIRDLVENGKGGVLVDPHSPTELATAIKTVCEKQQAWQRLGNYNLSVIQKYELRQVSDSVKNIYENAP